MKFGKRHLVLRRLALGLVVAAIASPGASAGATEPAQSTASWPFESFGLPDVGATKSAAATDSWPFPSFGGPDGSVSAATAPPTDNWPFESVGLALGDAPEPVNTVPTGSGIDWLDAGAGFVVGAGLVLILAVGLFFGRRRTGLIGV